MSPDRAPDAAVHRARRIVADASFLWERVGSGGFTSEAGDPDDPEVGRRVQRLCQVVADGDWTALRRRFGWDGHGLEDIRDSLGPVRYHGPLPGWARTLEEVLRAADAQPREPVAGAADRTACFREVLGPALTAGRRGLRRRLRRRGLPGLPSSVLSPAAYRSLEEHLLEVLVDVSAQVLEHELARGEPFGEGLLRLLDPAGTDGEGAGPHAEGMTRLLRGGLVPLVEEYPVLGRLIAMTVRSWAASTAEFLLRLAHDRPLIRGCFSRTGRPGDPGLVVGARAGLSDPHRGGRTAIAITFASGLEVVYKPKDLGMEAAFNGLIAWCNGRRAPLDLLPVRILDRGGYGWAEHVPHRECADEAAAERFYERAGMLLCLVHSLRGTDCHHENLIASGEYPVLVDAETLMHHEGRQIEDPTLSSESAVSRCLKGSVFRTGLLPRWDFSPSGRSAYDASGLGDPIGPDAQNVPRLGGGPLPAEDFQRQIAAGFARMYRFLMHNRAPLLAPGGPLEGFRCLRNRYIFRPSRVYGALRQKTWAPDCLRSGADCSIELEWLSSAFLAPADVPRSWPILRAELDAMMRLDIPLFQAEAGSDALSPGPGRTIPHFFQGDPASTVHTQLQAMDEAGLQRQLQLIEAAFCAKKAPAPHEAAQRPAPGMAPPPLTRVQLVEESTLIAQKLASAAVPDPEDGSLGWIGFAHDQDSGRFQVQELPEGLYDGRTGIAVLFAARFRLTGNPSHRTLALRTLQPLLRRARLMDPAARRRTATLIGIGGASGIGSLIYALLTAGRLLDEDTGPEALALSELVSPEAIEADHHLDVLGGSAGALLGLLPLHHATGQDAALERAIACGEHLLARRTSRDGGPRAWRTIAEAPLTGFSHGAAGIAYALTRLHESTHDPRFLEAALEGIAYENSLFSPTEANWPDLRRPHPTAGGPRHLNQWCHGAAGIALARLGCHRIHPTPETLHDIEAALALTHPDTAQAVDHLCCGNMGRVESLLVGAHELSRPDWARTAAQIATRAVHRAHQRGTYQLFAGSTTSVANPGLFQGLAGIGYQLLRLAHPDHLPSILLWE